MHTVAGNVFDGIECSPGERWSHNSIPTLAGNVKTKMKRGNGTQANFDLKMFAPLQRDGRGLVGIGCIRVIGGRVGHIQGGFDGGRVRFT